MIESSDPRGVGLQTPQFEELASRVTTTAGDSVLDGNGADNIDGGLGNDTVNGQVGQDLQVDNEGVDTLNDATAVSDEVFVLPALEA